MPKRILGRMAARMAVPMNKPEILHRVGAAVRLLDNVIDMGSPVGTVHKLAAELAASLVPGDHS